MAVAAAVTAALAVAAGLIVFHTSGQGWIKEVAERQLRASLDGCVAIGDLDVSLGGRVDARDIAVWQPGLERTPQLARMAERTPSRGSDVIRLPDNTSGLERAPEAAPDAGPDGLPDEVIDASVPYDCAAAPPRADPSAPDAVRVTLRIDRIEAVVNVWALIRGAVHVRDLDVAGVDARVWRLPDGSLNVEHLMRDDQDRQRRPMRFDQLAVRDARVRYEDPRLGIATAHLDARGWVDGSRLWADARLGVSWPDGPVEAELAVEVTSNRDRLAVAAREITEGRAPRLAWAQLEAGLGERPAVEAEALLELSAHDLAPLRARLPEAVRRQLAPGLAVTAAVSARRPDPDSAWRLDVQARTPGAEWAAWAEIDPAGGLRADLRADGVDPAALAPAAPAGALTAHASADLRWTDAPHGGGGPGGGLAVRGTIDAVLRGRLAGVTVRSATVALSLAPERIRGALAFTTGLGEGHGELDVGLGRDGIRIHALDVRGRIPEIATLARGQISGAVDSFRVTASGPLSSVTARAAVRLRDVVAGEARARAIAARAAASGVSLSPLRPTERVRLDVRADDVWYGAERVGDVTARGVMRTDLTAVDASVIVSDTPRARRARAAFALRLMPRARRLTLRAAEVRALDLTWRASGAVTLHDSGRVEARDVAIATDAFRVEIDGALPARWTPRGQDRLHVRVRDVALARLPLPPEIASRPELAGLAGAARADVSVTRGRRHLEVDAAVALDPVRARPHAPPVIALLGLALRDEYVDASADVFEPRTRSRVTASARVNAPDAPFDVAAWRASLVGPAVLEHVRQGEITAHRVDLGVISAVTGLALPVTGRVAARVRIPDRTVPGPDDFSFDVTATELRSSEPGVLRDLSTAGVLGELGASARGTWNARRLAATVEVAHHGARALTASGELALGYDDLIRSPTLPPDTRLTAKGTLDGLDLGLLSRLGLLQIALEGRVMGRLAASGSVGTPRVTLRDGRIEAPRVSGLALAGVTLAGELDAHQVTGRVGIGVGDGARAATARAGTAARGTLRLDGGYRWGAAAEDTGQLWGQLRARRLDLSMLQAFAAPGGPDSGATDVLSSVAGRLDADIRVDSAGGGPRASGWLALRDGAVTLPGGTHRLDEVTLRLTADAARAGGQAPGRVARVTRVTIQALSGRFDGGPIELRPRRAATPTARPTNYVDLTGGAGLDGLTPVTFALSVAARDIPIPGDEYQARVDAVLDVDGEVIDSGVALAVVLAPATAIRIEELDRRLHSLEPLADVVYADAAREARPRRRDGQPRGPFAVRLRIDAPAGVRLAYEDDLARVDARLRPALAGVFADGAIQSIDGTITLAPGARGEVWLFGYPYTIDEVTTIDFVPSRPLDPDLYVRLEGTFPQDVVYIDVVGRLSQLEGPEPAGAGLIRLSSQAGKDQTAILAIMLGLDPDDPDHAARMSTADAIVANLLAAKVRTRLPVRIDVVRTHHDGVSVGRWITRDLLLGYRYHSGADARTNESEVTFEWQLGQDWSLEGRYGDAEIGGADILWRIQF